MQTSHSWENIESTRDTDLYRCMDPEVGPQALYEHFIHRFLISWVCSKQPNTSHFLCLSTFYVKIRIDSPDPNFTKSKENILTDLYGSYLYEDLYFIFLYMRVI